MKKYNLINYCKSIFLFSALLFTSSTYAQEITSWVESSTNASLQMSNDGYFQYDGTDGQFQGVYGVQDNILSLQDANGNIMQYTVQEYSQTKMILVDQLGTTYNFVNINNSSQMTQKLPWEDKKYTKVIATNKNDEWLESHTQIYVNFIELLIWEPLNSSEINDIRASNLIDFKSNSQLALTDVSQTEAALKQLYSLNNAEAVAMFREELFASLITSSEQNPEINETVLMKIYSNHVVILKYDPTTRLSLSNQDVEAYIKYLQFQNMLMGQSITLTKDEGQMLQMQLVNGFTQMNLQQKQSIAFASYIWSGIEQQWSNLSPTEKTNYIAQVQEQMNIQNTTVSSQQVNATMNQNYNYGDDINGVAAQYEREAAANGMSIEAYIELRKQQMQSDSNMFTMMQNNMMESHALSMNIISKMGDGDTYYSVEY